MATSKQLRALLTGNGQHLDMFEAMAQANRCECERCGQDWATKSVAVPLVARESMVDGEPYRSLETVALNLCAWCAALPVGQHRDELEWSSRR
jgi:hypothetical protein